MKRIGPASIRPAWPAEPATESEPTSSATAGLLSPTPELTSAETHWLPAPSAPSAADLTALRRAVESRSGNPSPLASGGGTPHAPGTPALPSDPVARMLQSVAVLLALHDEVRVRRVGGGKG